MKIEVRVVKSRPTTRPSTCEQTMEAVLIVWRVSGEIARLEDRFRVKLDPQHQDGSHTIHLICRLEDRNLPSVPPLCVTVPEDYPSRAPTCNTSSEEYSESSLFCKTVEYYSTIIAQKLPKISTNPSTWSSNYFSAVTPFLEGVQKNLSSQLLNLPEKYSISALLDLWVSSLFDRSVVHVL